MSWRYLRIRIVSVFLSISLMLSQTVLAMPVQNEGIVYPPVFKALKFDGKFDLDFVWEGKFSSSAERRAAIGMFLTALTVPNRDWWVNLSVYETEDTILGKGLFNTELGRALLLSDIQLKKQAKLLLSPDTKTGADFWKEAGDITNTILPRFWIEPGETVVASNDESVYIKRMRLSVRAEIKGLPKTQSELIKKLLSRSIIPELEKSVNTAPEFALLRQAHSAFILSAWFKMHFAGSNNPVSSTINRYMIGTLQGRYVYEQRALLYDFVKMYYSSNNVLDYNVIGGGADETGIAQIINEENTDAPIEKIEDGSSARASITPKDIINNKQGAVGSQELQKLVIKFGTSGHRIDRSKLTGREVEDLIRADARALAIYYQRHKSEFEKEGVSGVLIGRDSRKNNEIYQGIIIDELVDAGIPVMYFDEPVPTPFIAFATRKLKKAVTVNLTASHNPPEYTGFKITPADGGAAAKEMTDEVQVLANKALEGNALPEKHRLEDLGLSEGPMGAVEIGIDFMIPEGNVEINAVNKSKATNSLLDAYVGYIESELQNIFGEKYHSIIVNARSKARNGDLRFLLTSLYGAGGKIQKYVIEKIFGKEAIAAVVGDVPKEDFGGLPSPNPAENILKSLLWKGASARRLSSDEREYIKPLLSIIKEIVDANDIDTIRNIVNNKWIKQSRSVSDAGPTTVLFLDLMNNVLQPVNSLIDLVKIKVEEVDINPKYREKFDKNVYTLRNIYNIWADAVYKDGPILIGSATGPGNIGPTQFLDFHTGYVLALDGDSDRYGLMDKMGRFISANDFLAILYDFIAQNKAKDKPIPALAKTVATSDFPSSVAKSYGGEVFDTAVGFKNMRPYWNRFGIAGESSAHGGILGGMTWDDGILFNVLAGIIAGNMEYDSFSRYKEAIEEKLGRSFVFKEIAVRVDDAPEIKENVIDMAGELSVLADEDAVVDKDVLEANKNKPAVNRLFAIANELDKSLSKVVLVDGIKAVFEDGSSFVLRPSGTEPVVRLCAESSSPEGRDVARLSTQKIINVVKNGLLRVQNNNQAGFVKGAGKFSFVAILLSLALIGALLMPLVVNAAPSPDAMASGYSLSNWLKFLAVIGALGLTIGIIQYVLRLKGKKESELPGHVRDLYIALLLPNAIPLDISKLDNAWQDFLFDLLFIKKENDYLIGDILKKILSSPNPLFMDARSYMLKNKRGEEELKADLEVVKGILDSEPVLIKDDAGTYQDLQGFAYDETDLFLVSQEGKDGIYLLLKGVDKAYPYEIDKSIADKLTSISKRLSGSGLSEGEREQAIESALKDVQGLLPDSVVNIVNDKVKNLFLEQGDITPGMAMALLSSLLKGANIGGSIADSIRHSASVALLNESLKGAFKNMDKKIASIFTDAYKIGKALVEELNSEKGALGQNVDNVDKNSSPQDLGGILLTRISITSIPV